MQAIQYLPCTDYSFITQCLQQRKKKSQIPSAFVAKLHLLARDHKSEIHQIGAKDKALLVTGYSAELCHHHCICFGVIVPSNHLL